MLPRAAAGRINVKVLVAIAAVLVLGGGGLLAAHYLRKNRIADTALGAAKAAVATADWNEAAKQFRRYLGKYPNDMQVLPQYAEALLTSRPLTAENLRTVIEVQRRILRVVEKQRLEERNPELHVELERAAVTLLARLYASAGDYTELSYLANQRLESDAFDAPATIWLAKSLVYQNKFDEAWKALSTFVTHVEQTKSHSREFVEACSMLAFLATKGQGIGSGPAKGVDSSAFQLAEPQNTAMQWLDWAVRYESNSARALVARANFYRISGAAAAGGERQRWFESARADLEQAEQMAGDDPFVRLMLSEEWREIGELERAGQQLALAANAPRAVLAREILDPDEWPARVFQLGAELVLRRQAVADGVQLADHALATTSKERAPRQRLAVLPDAIRLYVAAREHAKARAAFDEYVGALPAARDEAVNEASAFLESLVLWGEGKPYEVIRRFEPLIARNEMSARGWQLLADAYGRTDQTERAAEALKRAGELAAKERGATPGASDGVRSPADEVAVLQLEIPQVYDDPDLSKRAALKRRVEALVQRAPQEVEPRLLLASIALRDRRPDDARKILEDAVKACPDALRAELQLARLLALRGETETAVERLRAACEKYPAVADGWLALAELHRALNDLDAARAAVETGLTKVAAGAEQQDLKRARAIVDAFQGKYDEAIATLLALAKVDAGDVRTRMTILDLSRLPDDATRAQPVIDELRQIEGDSGLRWRYYQAKLWLATGQWRDHQQELEESLTRVIAADPSLVGAAICLGDLYERGGNLGKAEEVYRRALRPDASGYSTELEERLLALLERQGRFTDITALLDQLGSPQRWTGYQILAAERSGDRQQAIELLKQRVAGDAQDLNGRVLLARMIYAKSKDRAAALKVLDEAEMLAPGAPVITDTRVELLRADGAIDEARGIADGAVKRTGSFEAHLIRARLLAKLGEFDAAELDYLKLRDLDKDGAGYGLLGAFYKQTGRMDPAIAVWHEGVAKFPENAALDRELVRGYLTRGAAGDRERAEKLLARLEQVTPNDGELIAIRAALMIEEGQPAERVRAEELLKKLVALGDTRDEVLVPAYIQLVQMALERGEGDAARQRIAEARQKLPRELRFWLVQAEVERRLGDVRAAVNWAALVLKEAPESEDARKFILQTAITSGDGHAAQMALPFVQKQQELDPQNTELMLTLAELERIRGELDAAGRWIERAAKRTPDAPAVAIARLQWLAGKRDYERIVGLVTEYRQKGGQDPQIVATAAGVLATSGSAPYRKTAVELFEYLTRTAPEFVSAQLDLALLKYQTGDLDGAQALYRKVLETHPENYRALNDLAWILAETQSNLDEALEFSTRAVALAPQEPNLRDTRAYILTRRPAGLREALSEYQRAAELHPPISAARARALLKVARTAAEADEGAAAAAALKGVQAIDQKLNALSAKEREEVQSLLSKAAARP
ncbi:MAG: tetratricopeptide repeat protein [Phycisphaerae bacterium]